MTQHFRKLYTTLAFATVAVAGTASGFMTANVLAADAQDPRLAITSNMNDGNTITVWPGETTEQMAAAAKRGVTAVEEDATVGGHGAPQKLLIDNDVVRVNLVAFKKGFKRTGGMKRKYHQMLVYVDRGAYSLLNTDTPMPNRLAPGSIVFHRKDSIISNTQIDEDYRVLFVDMKK
jgi:hypothetical protein